jgi:predicted transcriptional regulator
MRPKSTRDVEMMTLWIDRDLKARLRNLAEKNFRPLSHEVTKALSEHARAEERKSAA